MELGITGLPQSGKTTIFNALTGNTVDTGGYSREEHRGTVKVPDPRLTKLAEMYEPRKVTPVVVQYVDVAGLVRGGAKDAAAQLFAALRTVDALLLVVRAFENDLVSEPEGGIDPLRDAADFDIEIILADLEVAERRVERLEKEVKAGRAENKPELDVLQRCVEALTAGTPLRDLEFSEEEERRIRGYRFLSGKPVIVVVNIGEDMLGDMDALNQRYAPLAEKPNVELVVLCGEIEMEISQLDEADQREFLSDLGIAEPALTRLIRESFRLLDLIVFFTAGGKDEARAWAIRKGTVAQKAAGEIHSDLERGFIRAETVAYEDLAACGSFTAAKEKGLLRLEGKEYVVKDGDVLTIRFSV